MQLLHSYMWSRPRRTTATTLGEGQLKSFALKLTVALICGWLSYGGAVCAATPYPLGVYVGNPDGTTPAYEALFEKNFASFASAMGAAPTLITTYVDYRQQVANWPSNAAWQAWSNAQSPIAKTLIPVIGFPMASIAAGTLTPDQQFQAFASGQYDNVIQGVVQAWVSSGFKKLVFRLGWEMNITGPTYAGSDSQSQGDWVKAFQHINQVIKIAAKSSGTTTWIVWNPNVTNYTYANAINNLYPGDAYVDIIGIDMYGGMYPYSDTSWPPHYHDWDTGLEDTSVAEFIADPINRAHYWTYPAATEWTNDSSAGHSLTFQAVVKFAILHGKWIAIPETGAGATPADISDDPTFPQSLAQQLNAAVVAGARISFVNIWDSNNGGSYEFSYSSDNKPQEKQAWRQYFGQ